MLVNVLKRIEVFWFFGSGIIFYDDCDECPVRRVNGIHRFPYVQGLKYRWRFSPITADPLLSEVNVHGTWLCGLTSFIQSKMYPSKLETRVVIFIQIE